MKQPVVLKVYRGEKLEAVRQFEQPQIVIGRNADAQLELQDPEVALLHSLVEDRDGVYFVSDLGSQAGTIRNGNKILEDKLESGDELQIGPYKIQFFIGVPKIAVPLKENTSAGTAAIPPVVVAPIAVTYTQPQPPPAPPAPPPVETRAPAAPPPPESESIGAASVVKHTPPAPPEKAVPPVPPPKLPTEIPKASDDRDKENERKTGAVILPEAPRLHRSHAGGTAHKSTGKKTFAPPSPYKDLNEVIKPKKGSSVEVIVAWKDRILSTNHFSKQGSVTISSDEGADVIVPIISSKSRYELLKVGSQVVVCLTQEMDGELTRDGKSVGFSELNRMKILRNAGSHFELDLRQGDLVKISLQNGLINIFVRFVPESQRPLVAPLLDMTSSEVTGVILALVVALIMGFYMNIYTPEPLIEDEARIEEPIRKAVVKFNPPTPKKIVEVVDKPVQEVKPVVKKQEQVRQTPTPSPEKAGDPGKAGEVAPKPEKNLPKKVTSARPGGAIKTAPKEGANMKSEKPDPNKVGLLGVFASKGAQSQLDKAYQGSGELQGVADQATGYAGSNEDRAGDQMGTKLKDTGAGGKGTATVGIAGVGTQGRGTGTTGYGTGGIGKKGSVQINVGGQEEGISGGMDREAIRRVVRQHLKEIRDCYERELQRSPDLYGKIVLEWDIVEEGRVSRADVKSNELGKDSVARCIINRLKTWKFPDPPKDTVGRVVFPFVFSSAQ